MNWRPADCRPGDMIRVDLGGFCHVGIFVSEDEVIQFGLPPVPENRGKANALTVQTTDIAAFACGRIVEVAELSRAERASAFPPEEILARARARLGEGGYNLIHNNCEHFANECVFGVKRCALEEDARLRWRNRPILDVFLAPVIRQEEPAEVFPPERQREIARCKSLAVRQEKAAAWLLLQAGLKKTFGLDAREVSFSQNRSGKWLCENAWFSLSHTGDWAAAAVSNKPVGVDIEAPALLESRYISLSGKLDKLKDKTYTAREKRDDATDDFLFRWTRKEAIFKRDGVGTFRPHRIESDDPLVRTRLCREPELVLSVCGEQVNAVRWYLYTDGAFTPLATVPFPVKE